MKICTVCKESKPFEDFHRSKRSKDGRGLLCAQCNGGLGMFEDSIPTLLKAIKYLEETNRLSTNQPKGNLI